MTLVRQRAVQRKFKCLKVRAVASGGLEADLSKLSGYIVSGQFNPFCADAASPQFIAGQVFDVSLEPALERVGKHRCYKQYDKRQKENKRYNPEQ